MRTRQPPSVAAWFLEHLSASRNDALAGDLSEEYQRGRSRWWYWKQVWIAILVSFFAEIRAHSLLAVRAVATGWAVWYLYSHFISLGVSWLLQPLEYSYPFAFGHVTPVVSVWWIVWLSVRAGSGWIVAKLHRNHATAMVMAFSASVLLWKLQMIPWTMHLALVSTGWDRYRQELIVNLMGITFPSLCILLGGLSGERSENRKESAG